MPIGLGVALLLSALAGGGASAASSVATRRGQKDQNENSLELERMRQSFEASENEKNRALEESTLNPYRTQLNQARSMGRLATMRGSGYTPYRMSRGSSYASPGAAPRGVGGFSFEADPTANRGIDLLLQSVMRGETPANRQPSGGHNVLSLLSRAG